MLHSFVAISILYLVAFILSLRKQFNQSGADLDYVVYIGAVIIGLVQFYLVPAPLLGFFILSIICLILSFVSWKEAHYYKEKNRISRNKNLEQKAKLYDGFTFFLLNFSFLLILVQYF